MRPFKLGSTCRKRKSSHDLKGPDREVSLSFVQKTLAVGQRKRAQDTYQIVKEFSHWVKIEFN